MQAVSGRKFGASVGILRELALRLPSEFEPIDQRELGKQLQFLAATLPSKNVDEQAGQMRYSVYVRFLGSQTVEAIEYMTERALRELDWFPTPHQCLDILEGYRPPVTRKDRALHLCAQHTQAKFEAFRERLRTEVVEQSDIDAAPDRWKRIFENEGRLKIVDGQYQQRLREIQ